MIVLTIFLVYHWLTTKNGAMSYWPLTISIIEGRMGSKNTAWDQHYRMQDYNAMILTLLWVDKFSGAWSLLELEGVNAICLQNLNIYAYIVL